MIISRYPEKIREKVFFFLSLLVVLTAVSAAAADTRFVRPDIDIPVRRGKGEQYKIIKFVRDGNQVELLEESGHWAKVRLEGGTEGWMFKRHLGETMPPAERLQELQDNNTNFEEENKKLKEKIGRIEELQLAANEELEQLRTSAEEKLATCVREKNRLESQKKVSKEVDRTIWFLSGAGVLLLGWLIGRYAAGSQKRRSRLL
ncbi:MAG: TIGR04211 family SH3 domain-containing protein [Candidatus Electrothrix sp. YB6]